MLSKVGFEETEISAGTSVSDYRWKKIEKWGPQGLQISDYCVDTNRSNEGNIIKLSTKGRPCIMPLFVTKSPPGVLF